MWVLFFLLYNSLNVPKRMVKKSHIEFGQTKICVTWLFLNYQKWHETCKTYDNGWWVRTTCKYALQTISILCPKTGSIQDRESMDKFLLIKRACIPTLYRERTWNMPLVYDRLRKNIICTWLEMVNSLVPPYVMQDFLLTCFWQIEYLALCNIN